MSEGERGRFGDNTLQRPFLGRAWKGISAGNMNKHLFLAARKHKQPSSTLETARGSSAAEKPPPQEPGKTPSPFSLLVSAVIASRNSGQELLYLSFNMYYYIITQISGRF